MKNETMQKVRLVVNILILVLVPIIMNRQRIMNYINESGIQEKSGSAINSIKDTSAKTFKGAKNISSSVYSNTKDTIENLSSNVGEKVNSLTNDNEDLDVPKILKSQNNDEAVKIAELENINVKHEKEIDAKMLENIAKLNEEKVAKHRDYEDSLQPGELHKKHKYALDTKAVDSDVSNIDAHHNNDDEDNGDNNQSLFLQHRKKHEEHIQEIGRKTGI